MNDYTHGWWPSKKADIPVDRCRHCGIIRRMDGKSDGRICPAVVAARATGQKL